MLYEYNGKIYIKIYENKIVEVTIKKVADGYSVEPTDKVVMEDNIIRKIQSISLEDAYNLISAKKTLKSKEEF